MINPSKHGHYMSELIGVQKKYAPNSICFGCGPANKKGLKIDSHRIEGGLRTEFKTIMKLFIIDSNLLQNIYRDVNLTYTHM